MLLISIVLHVMCQGIEGNKSTVVIVWERHVVINYISKKSYCFWNTRYME